MSDPRHPPLQPGGVVMDRCFKIEYGRLFGELGRAGVSTGVISSDDLIRDLDQALERARA